MTDRRFAERRGRDAETKALWWLRLKGYRLLARRLKTPVGELDLVVSRGRWLVFVEVKARETFDEAAWAASRPAEQLRRRRAAAWWLSRHPEDTDRPCRFDVVLVAPGRWPRHLAGVE
jgi:putative endonuclease